MHLNINGNIYNPKLVAVATLGLTPWNPHSPQPYGENCLKGQADLGAEDTSELQND